MKVQEVNIHQNVGEINYDEYKNTNKNKTSAEIKKNIERARKRQEKRYEEDDILTNSQLNSKLINKYLTLDDKGQKMAEYFYDKYKLSNRSYTKILKVAMTIADLNESEYIGEKEIIEAFSFRNAYYKYFQENER